MAKNTTHINYDLLYRRMIEDIGAATGVYPDQNLNWRELCTLYLTVVSDEDATCG